MNAERVIGLRGWLLRWGEEDLWWLCDIAMRCDLCYSIRTYKVYDCYYSVSGYHMQTIIRLQTTPLSSQAKLPYPSLSYQPALIPTLLPSPNRCSRLFLTFSEQKQQTTAPTYAEQQRWKRRRLLLRAPLLSPLSVQPSPQLSHPTRINPPVTSNSILPQK